MPNPGHLSSLFLKSMTLPKWKAANLLPLRKLFPSRMQKLFALLLSPARIIAMAAFLFLLPKAQAQDKHFTQFYASPLTLNPALSRAREGR